MENELRTLTSSSTTSLSEIETLRSRITSLETSNRETLAILDAKTSANADLSEELQRQHQKNVKLGQEVSSLQQSLQSALATTNSAKFRQQSLQQELELSRRSNEWLESELKTKSAEALKYRKEKGARIAELQRQNEEASSTAESLTRSEQQIRSRLDTAQQKADEALAKVQQLQEAGARVEEGFRTELEAAKRLVQLKDQQTDTHRLRLKEVELRLEQVKDEGEAEVRRVRKELEQVREELKESNQRAQDLETEGDRLQAMLSSQQHPPSSRPQTPRANGSHLRAPSPFGTPGSVRGKSAVTAAQAIEDLYKARGDLAGERRRNQQLSQEVDDMMAAMEAKGPEIDDLQQENERLRNDNVQMTRIADESFQHRDLATKAAKKAEAANSKAQAEVQILQAQLRDLSTQIQLLVFNLHAREKGYDQLTEEEALQFQRLQKGQITESSLDDMSDTHQFISERFVAFKDIQELQGKNEQLLKMTRELAIQMESEEAAAAQRQALKDQEDVKELHETISRMQDETKSITTRMKSYMAERDMFRRMLQQKANAAEISSVLGPSVDGSHRGVLASIEQNSPMDEGDLTIALRELQNNFDSYRNEQAIDRQTMREQVEKLSTARSSLQAEVAKLNSQLTLASERYEMLNSNFTAVQTENKELQKRSQHLSESAAKQDIRTQQVAEDLIETRGMLESMRGENANLKAEKTLWKGIQERISQDNENLVQEKSRLNSLLASQQSLQNERELSESETRRRLQTQVDNLEAELATTKRRLSEEVDESKKLQLRKEYDAQQAQKRIDDLIASIGQSKEDLVANKTSRDHLQARVDELTIELRNAEERAQRLQPRPTPRTPAASQQDGGGHDLTGRVQELEDEVLELRRDLELARSQLDHTRSQADSFKELAEAAESDLNSLNDAQEQYREEMDSALSGKDAKIKELEQRIDDLSTELASSNTQLTSIRDSQADVSRKFDDEKRILDAEIARLKEEEDGYKEEKKWHQADLRAQADIAAKAQQDYEQELFKHGEARKQLQNLRSEYNKHRTESASWRAEADSAKLTLTQSEHSWEDRRQQLEKEILELQGRWNDTNSQNKLLHEQLASVTAQISGLQQSRTGSDGADPSSAVAGTAIDGLRELNNYLRREKEILEVQFDLKVQEAGRLQQRVEYAQSQLDEARLKLEQERRSQADNSRSSLTHKDLMDKLNELNLIRESNSTLRAESQQMRAQLGQKTTQVEELEAKIQPLEARISELENQKVFLEEELKQVSEDRERWQKRTEGILTKYGRVDPVEMDELKQAIAGLEAERDALKESEAPLKAKIEELEADKVQWQASREKIISQAKEKARQQNAQIKDVAAQKSDLEGQLGIANEGLASAEKDLQRVTGEKSALEAQIGTLQQQIQAAASSAPPAVDGLADSMASANIARLETELGTLRGDLETARAQKAQASRELDELRLQLEAVAKERDDATARAQQPQQNGEDVNMQNGIRDTDDAPASRTSIADAERAELLAKIDAANALIADAARKAAEKEDLVKSRSDKMKDALNKKLKEVKDKHEQDLRESREKMDAEYSLRMTQEKQIWLAEQAVHAAAPATPSKPIDSQPPLTPAPHLLAADFSKLGDKEIRDLLSTNTTLKAIVTGNIKSKVDTETKRAREAAEQDMKAEYEAKVASARDNGQQLAETRGRLRINMAENKVKLAEAKLNVVSTAAEKTPERPVGEVWDEAKDAKPAPAVAPAQPAAPSPAPQSTPRLLQIRGLASRATNTSTVSNTPSTAPTTGETRPQQLTTSQPPPKPAPRQAASSPITPSSVPINPFANPNPLAAKQNTAASNPFAGQEQNGPPTGPPTGPPLRSGIPIPGGNRGGGGGGGTNRGANRGGAHQARGAQGAPRGRGGGAVGGAGGAGGPLPRNPSGMNPGADNFNPNHKRPRDESEAGNRGGKRQRGGQGH